VFWSVRSLPTARRFSIGVFYHPIYRLAAGFNDLEAQEEEAEFLVCFNQGGRTLHREVITNSKGKGWILEIFCIQLGVILGIHIFTILLYILEALSATHTVLLYVFQTCSTLYEVGYISK
jgi:hypothetical protein